MLTRNGYHWLLLLVTLTASLVVIVSRTPVRAADRIIVSAAASLGGVLDSIKDAFEAKHAGLKLELNLGSSGALRHQIEHGAPVDVFLSAAEGPMQALVDIGLVDGDEVTVFATNRLVLIRSAYAPAALGSWEDLAHGPIQRIAMGNPEHVPAGEYGQAVLEALDLWGPLQKKLVFGEDVRHVLAFVESGAAAAGLVYSTDAAAAERVHVVAGAPAGTHAPITYPAGVVRTSRVPDKARAFVEYLLSEEGQATLAEYGFGGPEN